MTTIQKEGVSKEGLQAQFIDHTDDPELIRKRREARRNMTDAAKQEILTQILDRTVRENLDQIAQEQIAHHRKEQAKKEQREKEKELAVRN